MHIADRDLTTDETASLNRAMNTIRNHMPPEAVYNLIQHTLKAAITYRRTHDVQVLDESARSLLATIRLRSQEHHRTTMTNMNNTGNGAKDRGTDDGANGGGETAEEILEALRE
jgi:hypothetical protein